MKTLILAFSAFLAFGASAEIVYTEENPPPRKPMKDRTPEEREALKKFLVQHELVVTGGKIPMRGSNKGKIVFLDAQTRFTEVTNVIGVIDGMIPLPMSYAKVQPASVADPVAALAENKADIAVVIVDDATTPVILVSPEERWVKMNVAKVDKGLKGPLAEKMFVQRCRKELLRAFTYVSGGIASQFPRNICAVSKVEDLDFVKEFIPVDMPGRFESYLEGVGVTPRRMTTYLEACKAGWAPTPTNKFQQAIWDKVHEAPSDPLTIKFDKKKGE